jgi:hypothetical protein
VRGRAARVALPLAAVLALVSVVAIAASGSTSRGTSDARGPSDSLLDAFFTLWILGAVAGGVLLVYGLMQRKAIAAELASGRYRRTSLTAFLALIVIIVGAIAVARRLNLTRHAPGAVEEQPPFNVGPSVPTTPDQKPTVVYEPGISWFVVAIVVGLVLAAAIAYVLSRRRMAVLREPDLAEQLAAALDDAVDDLRSETDPRRAIIAAYARMERVLAASGVPRRTAETADEYLARVLLELAPGSDAVTRLTNLFSQAKFSHHEIDATMKEEAIDALEQVRDELRSSTAEPVETAERAPVEAPS